MDASYNYEFLAHPKIISGKCSLENIPAELAGYDAQKPLVIARKSIVARCAIKKGDILTEDNVTTKRPGNGISPMRWFEVLGTKAVRDFDEDELIEL